MEHPASQLCTILICVPKLLNRQLLAKHFLVYISNEIIQPPFSRASRYFNLVDLNKVSLKKLLYNLLLMENGSCLMLLLYPVPKKVSKIWMIKDDPTLLFLKYLSCAQNHTCLAMNIYSPVDTKCSFSYILNVAVFTCLKINKVLRVT